MDYIFVGCFVAVFFVAVGYVFLMGGKQRERTIYGVFNGQKYVFHMNVMLKGGREFKFDLFGDVDYEYPEQVLSHVCDNRIVHEYTVNFGHKTLFIQKDAIESICMEMEETGKIRMKN